MSSSRSSWRRSALARLRRDVATYLANALPPTEIRKFAIVGSARTGSELLVDLLNSHPQIECESEILATQPLSPYFLAQGRAKMAKRKGFAAYGFKMITIQFDFFTPPSRVLLENLACGGFLFVRLRRRNLLRQAISYLRAEGGGIWHAQRGSGRPPPMLIDPAEVIFTIRLFELQNQALDFALRDLPQLEVVYDDDLETPESHQPTIDRICRSLDLEIQNARTTMTKTSSSVASRDVGNFEDIRESLAGTRFERYLDM